jgi:hypothetical protein
MGAESPPPDGVMVIVPVNGPFGINVKLAEAALSAPPVGPVKLKVVTGETGVAEFDVPEAALVPTAFVAVTVQV